MSDYSEHLINLSKYTRLLSDLLNDRKYELALPVALSATAELYKVYSWIHEQVETN